MQECVVVGMLAATVIGLSAASAAEPRQRDRSHKPARRVRLAFRGVDELMIAYEKAGNYLGKYSIDAAGRIFENGRQVIIEGVEVIAKQF